MKTNTGGITMTALQQLHQDFLAKLATVDPVDETEAQFQARTLRIIDGRTRTFYELHPCAIR